jgi:hypothetical protein
MKDGIVMLVDAFVRSFSIKVERGHLHKLRGFETISLLTTVSNGFRFEAPRRAKCFSPPFELPFTKA